MAWARVISGPAKPNALSTVLLVSFYNIAHNIEMYTGKLEILPAQEQGFSSAQWSSHTPAVQDKRYSFTDDETHTHSQSLQLKTLKSKRQ